MQHLGIGKLILEKVRSFLSTVIGITIIHIQRNS